MAPSTGSSPAPSELCPLLGARGRGVVHRCRLWMRAGRPLLCEQRGSVVWLFKAQMVSQHRTPLGLDIIPNSAKVSSLPLTPSNLSVLPRASCKTEKNITFLPCFACLSGSSSEGKVFYCMLCRQHKAVLLVEAFRCCCSAIKIQTEQEV